MLLQLIEQLERMNETLARLESNLSKATERIESAMWEMVDDGSNE